MWWNRYILHNPSFMYLLIMFCIVPLLPKLLEVIVRIASYLTLVPLRREQKAMQKKLMNKPHDKSNKR